MKPRASHDPERRTPAHASGGGPPWIFGLRGAPQEAPENTLTGLSRALALGLDGVAYDVRACAGGDLVLMADAYVDRTTDLCGLLSETSPVELSRADAGAHFSPRFTGERVPYLGEALALGPEGRDELPQHVITAHEPETLDAIAAQVREHGARLSVRVASDSLHVCRAARELGLQSMWIAPRLDDRARDAAREEQLAAIAAPPSAWKAAARGAWPCERWRLRCDRPEDLLAACLEPCNALLTSEPTRALAIRRLVATASRGLDEFPLDVSPLEIAPATRLESEGEWCGRWRPRARLVSPFERSVRVEWDVRVRRGAFEAGELPPPSELAPGGVLEFEFEFAGGSWSPGSDPLLVARVTSEHGVLELDAPLERVRVAVLRENATRLTMLRESPNDPPASVTVRRHRSDLLAAIESAGDLEGARVVVRLGDEVVFGAQGARVRLPAGFDHLAGGAPFSIGVLGARRAPGGRRRVLRRWAGGLPDVAPSGAPGRLRSGMRA